jgi:hypothetical protein
MLDFLVASLATWRMTSLLVRERGPYDLLARARRASRTTPVGGAFACFYCASLWVAAPIAFWLVGASRSWPVVWLAISGLAVLLDRATTKELPMDLLELDEAIEQTRVRR